MADHLGTDRPRALVFISRSAPYGKDRPATCLEMALAFAAYDQQVSLVFMEDGVYQLLKHQHPEAIRTRNLAANLKAVPLYGIEKVYVDRHAMQQRGLFPGDLEIEVSLLDDEQLQAIVHHADAVFTL